MKIKKYPFALGGFLLSFSALIFYGASIVSAAPLTCTWTGAGTDSNFSTAANWSGCNNASPVSGDNLVFDGSATNKSPDDDISGLSIANMSFIGESGFDITGGIITITNGITDNSIDTNSNTIEINNTTLSGTQSISGSHQFNLVFGTGASHILHVTGGTLTFDHMDATVNATIIGDANLVMDHVAVGFTADTPSFSGSMSLTNGSLVGFNDGTLGTGAITVTDGSTLVVTTSATSLTLPNTLTLAGSGFQNDGALFSFIGNCTSTCPANSQLNLSGPVTLTANTVVNPNGSKVAFTNTVNANCFTLTAMSGTLTDPNIQNSSSCSGTVGSGTTVSTPGTPVPRTPNTGLGTIHSNVPLVLGMSSISALVLMILAFRFRKKITRT